jgi:hypothetical protein
MKQAPDRIPRSEGKLLEIIPIITDTWGQPMMLPPVVYNVDNWLMGYVDEHVVAMPYTVWFNEKVTLPGTGANSAQLSFLVRVMERSPDALTNATGVQVDMEAVAAIVNAIKTASK